jgi:VWFA-related protein
MRAAGVVALCIVALAPASAEQRQVFTSSTTAIQVDVLATEKGKPVAGLTAADFELRDNDVLQTIDLVDSGQLAVNAVLALDVSSSSAGPRLDDLLAAGRALLDGLVSRDRASITTFSHVVAPRVPLTHDIASVRTVLEDVDPKGLTSVIDGIYVAVMSAQSEAGRPLVVVFTDGRDTESWLRPEELLEGSKRASAVVYSVATGSARNWRFLEDLAEATGGRAITLNSSKDLRPEFEKILREFRSRYVLSFTPQGVSDTGYHRLTVRVKRSGVSVKARPGYTAGAGR